MPFDGNGTFNRVMTWVQDAASAIKIKSDRHDQNDDDIAAGLTNTITKDGQTQPTADIPMNSKKIVNLADPTNPTDAANKKYVDALKTFSTGLEISGADANGTLKFSSSTGANGLAFTGADLSWLARLADGTATPPKLNRMVLNDKPDGSGADVIIANDDGNLIAKMLTAQAPGAQVAIRPASGNGHVYWYAADGTQRMVMYTTSGAQGSGFLTVGGQSFEFNTSGQIKTAGAHFAGNAYLNVDGNIGGGTVWATWGAADAFNAISARIEARAIAWANDRIASTQFRRVSNSYSGPASSFIAPSGAVIVGYERDAGNAGQVRGLYYMYLQAYDPVRGWVGFGG